MPAKDVLSSIVADYVAANPDADAALLAAFQAYAAQWLLNRGVIGLGHAENGMALRFSDGEELMLFTRELPESPAARGVVNITGNVGSKVTKPPLGDSPSFSITGR